jgi:hypothetical protein
LTANSSFQALELAISQGDLLSLASYDDKKWLFVDNDGNKEKLSQSMDRCRVLRCLSCGLIVVPGEST